MEARVGRTGAVACVLGSLMVLLLAVPAHAASSTSAKEWADGLCSAVSDFGDSVDSTLTGLKGAGSLEDASSKAKQGLDGAVQTLESSLQDLGKPPTSDGNKAQSTVEHLGETLSDSVASVEKLLSPPPTTAQEIASTFAQIGNEVQKAVSEVKSSAATLKGLKPNGTLQKALQNAPACVELKSSR